jgi:hypothetical protein
MERHFMMTAIKNAASENKTFDVEDLTFENNCIIKQGRFLGKVRVLPNMALMAVIGENGKAYDIPLYLLTDKSMERLYEQSEVYGEVRCDYLNEEDNWWCIDAWKTADDNEEGEVVGWVDAVSGNIYYKHEKAMCSQKVREVALAKQAEIRAEKKKVWVVSIVEYKADDNYLDSYTELYANEEQAKARVDEYSTKAIDAAPEHDGLDDGGELVGEQGYVTYFKNGDIAKVKYAEKEVK